jgi:hypothetical protein
MSRINTNPFGSWQYVANSVKIRESWSEKRQILHLLSLRFGAVQDSLVVSARLIVSSFI